MHPDLHLGDVVVDAYVTFFVLGWLVGGGVFYGEVKRRGWPLEKLLFAMVGCVFGAVVGALLFGVLFFDWPEVIARVSALELVGKSVVGGVLGGFFGVEVAKKIVGYPHSTGDAFALAIPLGHAVGRIGCLLGGCCYGTPTSVPWAIRYPGRAPAHVTQAAHGQVAADAAWSLPVHPTPLYELGFDLVLFFALFVLRDRLRIRGSLFRLYLLSYATFRLGLEFVRGDSPFPAMGGPKPIQLVLIAVVLRHGWLMWRDEGRASVRPRPGTA